MRIDPQGRTLVPIEVREKFTLKPNDFICFALTEERNVYRIFCLSDVPTGVKRIMDATVKVDQHYRIIIPKIIRSISPSSMCIWFSFNKEYYLKFC